MRLNVTIRWTPADFPGRFGRYRSVIETGVSNLVKALLMVGVREATREAPIDRRRLRDSLGPGASQSFSRAYPTYATLGSRLIYAGAQEDADQFTARKRWWPPFEPIREWVRRKRGAFGISSAAEIGRVAAAIRRKIALRGIRPKRYLQAGMRAVEREASGLAERHVKAMLRGMGFDV